VGADFTGAVEVDSMGAVEASMAGSGVGFGAAAGFAAEVAFAVEASVAALPGEGFGAA
jgi:hypothetical protein